MLADGFRLGAGRRARRLRPGRAASSTCSPAAGATNGSSWFVRRRRDDPHVPSLAGISFLRPAGSNARCATCTASRPIDHPLPRRLVRHAHWPQGWYPMRRDAGRPPPFGGRRGPSRFCTVEGPGVYEIPVGPVHAGLIEPGHFRFSVVGETILKLKARLWFVHRGIEKLFEGRRPPNGGRAGRAGQRRHRRRAHPGVLPGRRGRPRRRGAPRTRSGVARRSCSSWNGCTTTSPTSARCATTSATASSTPTRSASASNCCGINDQVTGHRLLRGAHPPPAARTLRQLPDPHDALAGSPRTSPRSSDLALGHSVVRDRFTGTAVLTADAGRRPRHARLRRPRQRGDHRRPPRPPLPRPGGGSPR